MDAWYYARDGKQHGPYPKSELIRMLVAGTVKPDDHVWTDGMAEWETADQVPGLIKAAEPEPVTLTAPPATAQADEAAAPVEAIDVPNYLPWAIAVTLCCCLPGGVVAIVYSSQSTSAANRGDWVAAQTAAERAKQWMIVSAVIGGLLNLIGPVISLFAGVQM